MRIGTVSVKASPLAKKARGLTYRIAEKKRKNVCSSFFVFFSKNHGNRGEYLVAQGFSPLE